MFLKKLSQYAQQYKLPATLVGFFMGISACYIDNPNISTWLASGGFLLSSLLMLNDTPFVRHYFKNQSSEDTQTPEQLVLVQNILIFTFPLNTQTIRNRSILELCNQKTPLRPD